MLKIAKTLLHAVFMTAAFLPAALTAFGRWKAPYTFFAHVYALAPGMPGDYLRIAFYKLTLRESSLSSRVSFGSFFAHPEARLGPHVYIGPYSIIGKASIGERAQIASGVQVLSGRHQHARDASGKISGADKGAFTPVSIGADAWIGAAAVVMADVGAGSTVGAGSLVSRPVPPGMVAVGNPARVIRSAAAEAQ
jgi:acetyltransferase-like isoleucine patch superfamily enzyme